MAKKAAKRARRVIRKASSKTKRSAGPKRALANAPSVAPRELSKLDRLVAALKAPKGACVAELMALTGWQAHSVRGALAGALKRRGHTIISTKTAGGATASRAASEHGSEGAGAHCSAARVRGAPTMKETPEIESLSGLRLNALRQAWRAHFKDEPPAFRSRDLFLRAFAQRLEIALQGDLKPRLKKRLTELAQRFVADPDFDPAPRAALTIGSALVRDWNGARHIVLVTPDGFRYLDETYASLTQAAKAITGKHQSGPRFFGLTGKSVEP